jgi:hypothetical protein
MPLEVHWLTSTATSSLHAAEAMFRGAPLADSATAEALAEEVHRLAGLIAAAGIDADRFFEHALPLSARFDVPLAWSKAVCGKLRGAAQQGDLPERLARQFAALQLAVSRKNPRLHEELELRAEPLRAQWEARGPGLMAAVARRTEPELIVSTADVVLVQPVSGGGGAAHVLYNSARIEAVLANPIAELPEVVRLGWLLAQLNLELPRYRGALHRRRLVELWSLAMIPPVLAAAEDVELARFDAETIATALANWTRDDRLSSVDTLVQWWETYESAKPAWGVALGALDRMLTEA